MTKKAKTPDKLKMQSRKKTATSTFTLIRNSLLLLMGILFLSTLLKPVSALAADRLVVEDNADLLSPEEEARLIDDYSAITEYMDAAFITMDVPSVGTAAYAEEYAIAHYGNSPAVIFIIDMYDRQLYIYTNGSALKTITRADSRAITDNIYKSASKGNYYECADQAFSQILGKCRGERLARPVKHITNALIAVLCGILLNYCFTVYSRIPSVDRRTTGNVNVSVSRQMANMPGISLALPIVLSSVKRYKSRSSGGGGHGGGGGHSGGGGGHGF